MSKMKYKNFIVFCFLFVASFHARGTEILDWDSIPEGEVDNKWDNIERDASNFIWNTLDDNTFFNNWLYPGRVRLGFRAQRRVYDNKTPQSNFTVVDTIFLPLGIPLHSYTFSGGSFGVSLNLNLNTKIAHFRQVDSGALRTLPPISDWDKNAKSLMREGKKLGLKKESRSNERRRIKDVFDDNPLAKARYSKIFNLLTHPFKLPLTKKRVIEMDSGEIHSYTLSGHLGLSARVGWKTPKIPRVGGLNAASSVTAFIYGDFRISVLKEENNRVQVKVTRLKSAGISGNVGAPSDYYTPFQGVFLLDKIGVQIVPFSINAKKEWLQQFDVGYRFDLNESDAMEAYLKAVTGNFKRAEELTIQERGVEKTFTRKTTSTGSHSRLSINLSLLFSQYSRSTNKLSEVELTTPDGKTKIFRAYNSNGKGYRSITGHGEDQGQTFITTFEEEGGGFGKPATLRINGHMWDKKTSGVELRQYVDKVQNIIGDRHKFASFPVYGPRKTCSKKILRHIARSSEDRPSILRKLCMSSRKPISYGYSSFNYKMIFNERHVRRFINFPEDEMWRVLEGAFRVKDGAWLTEDDRIKYGLKFFPASLVYGPTALMGLHIKEGGNLFAARRFRKYWIRLKSARSKKELAKEFNQLFKTFNFGFEFIRVLKETLKREKYLVSVSASNAQSFGQYAFTDKNFTDRDPIDYTIDNSINFEKPYKTNIDYNSVISKFKLGRMGKKKVGIGFKLSRTPKYVFIKIDKSPHLRARQNLFKKV
ncbi:MAG: hypothetical protein VYD54_08715, partial [Bdellovibrionota bacterium]|nr:hypothetical protein [Bdellovibrionota bacterium]